MDQSLDDFQLPRLKKLRRVKKTSVRKTSSSQPTNLLHDNRHDNLKTLNIEIEPLQGGKTSTTAANDDTLDEVEEIENFFENQSHSFPKPDNSISSTSANNLKDEIQKDKKQKRNFDEDVEGSVMDDVSIPVLQNLPDLCCSPGGICNICNKKIPKSECQDHHRRCMRERFASESDRNCPTCGKYIVSKAEFTIHTKACEELNIKACREILNEPKVTSSYFNIKEGIKKDSKEEMVDFNCPTCEKDLTNFNTSSRQHHINRCLDGQLSHGNVLTRKCSPSKRQIKQGHESGSASEDKSSFVCSKCDKVLKSSRGLKIHRKACLNKDGNAMQTKTKGKQRRVLRNPKSEDEEQIQIAKALSKSQLKMEKSKKKTSRTRKKEVPVPVMLEMSVNSRKAAVDARVAELVMNAVSSSDKQSDEENEFSSTPVLPAPKWNSRKSRSGNTETSSDESVVLIQNTSDMNNQHASNEDKNVTDSDLDVLSNRKTYSDVKEPDETGSKQYKFKSKFAKTSKSKWGLTGENILRNENYTVSGLLSQFEVRKTLQVEVVDIISAEDGSLENEVTKSPKQVFKQNDKVLQDMCFTISPDASNNSLCFNDSTPPQPHNEINEETNISLMMDEQVPAVEDTTSFNEENVSKTTHQVQNDQNTCVNDPTSSTEVGSNPPLYKQLLCLSTDMGKLLNNEKYSDMTLVFPEGSRETTLHVHRCMLLCRAPQLLKSLERHCNKMDICYLKLSNLADFSPLLYHIYTGCGDIGDYLQQLDKVLKQLAEEDHTLGGRSNSLLHQNSETEVNSIEQLFDASDYEVVQPTCDESVEEIGQSSEMGTKQCSVRLHKILDVETCSETDKSESDCRSQSSVLHSDDDLFETTTPKISMKRLNHYSPCPTSGGVSSVDYVDESAFVFEGCALNNYSADSLDQYDSPKDKRVTQLKRKSLHITPIVGNRSKSRRMAGSTPKSVVQHKDNVMQSPMNVSDLSAIFPQNETERSNKPQFKTPKRESLSESANSDYESDPPAEKLPFQNLTEETSNTNSTPGCAKDFSETLELDSVLIRALEEADNVQGGSKHNDNFKTPKMKTRSKKTSDMVPITPMPNYSDLDTPEIIKKGQDFGLKKTLGKRKIKTKLKEAFLYNHQVESSSEDEQPDMNDNDKHVAVTSTSPLLLHNYETETESELTMDGADEVNNVVLEISSSDSNDGSDIEELHRTLFVPAASQHYDITSTSGDDVASTEASKIKKKVKPHNVEELGKRLLQMITSDEALYSDILQYKPIYLSQFKRKLETENFRCTSNELLDFLDKQGITFSTADERKEKQTRRKTKRKTKI
nr:uncharacterized protein LOC100186194 isoform X1 [Ciona intestinalis]|eukprot:XP_009857608.2 uncharacterized protein LOC100186194 isoform X1 [Ciona intestinalis]